MRSNESVQKRRDWIELILLVLIWNRLKLWDLTTPQHPTDSFERHSHAVYTARWSPTDSTTQGGGNTFVSASRDQSVLVWDKRTASTTAGAIGPATHPAAITALCYDSVNANLLYTGSEVGVISLYDVRSAKLPLATYNVCSIDTRRSVGHSKPNMLVFAFVVLCCVVVCLTHSAVSI